MKRISFFVCLVLAAVLLCAGAQAAGSPTSGSCGNNLTWSLDSAGKLTISGSGPMDHYDDDNPAPWMGSITNILTVSVGEGVTGIGDCAFRRCTSLTKVQFPASLESIGASAFEGCTALSKLDLNEGLINIETAAFADCDALTHAAIPVSVEYIEERSFSDCGALRQAVISGGTEICDEAFEYCTNLRSVVFSPELETVGDDVFAGCPLLNTVWYGGSVNERGDITFGTGNDKISKATWNYGQYGVSTAGDAVGWDIGGDGCLDVTCEGTMADWSNAEAPWYPLRYLISAASIDNTDRIAPYSFAGCRNMTSVSIPDGVTEIGASAFNNCRSLRDPVFPDGLSTIGEEAFAHCDSLRFLMLPDTVSQIRIAAFNHCRNLLSAEMPGIVRIESHAFAYSSLQSIALGEGVQQILTAAFMDCVSLGNVFYGGSEADRDDITIGNGNGALWEATWHYGMLAAGVCGEDVTWDLTSDNTLTITGSGDMDDWTESERSPWYIYRHMIGTVSIGSGVTNIGDRAFINCANLSSVLIPDTVTSIGDNAFENCVTMTRIDLPEGITWIGPFAFNGCTGLTQFRIPSGVKYIRQQTFGGCSGLTAVVIPCVTSISQQAFSGCDHLTTVTLGTSVSIIEHEVFYRCTALADVYYAGTQAERGSITIGSSNSWFTGAHWHYGVLGGGTCGSALTWALDVEGTLSISGSGAMSDWTEAGAPWYSLRGEIREVTITDGVTSIGAYAFTACANAIRFDLPESITSIGNNAFSYCSRLWHIILPSGLEEIGPYAFAHCEVLDWITLPGNVTEIGTGAFSDCGALRIVDINSAAVIGESAFANTDLLVIGIYGDVRTIGNDAFPIGTERPHIYYFGTEENRNTMNVGTGNDAFFYGVWHLGTKGGYCGPTMTWELNGQGLLTIQGTGDMFQVGMPAPWDTFRNEILSVSIAPGVTGIGVLAFNKCVNMTAVTIPSTVTKIGASAFENCRSLTEITIPESVSQLGVRSFAGCVSLVKVKLPDYMSLLPEQAFVGCSSLKDVVAFGQSRIDPSAFEGCESLKALVLGENMTAIGENAFKDCSALTQVCYAGLESGYASMTIGTGNTCLTGARWYYNMMGGGICGDDLLWRVSKEKSLIIEGSGAMPDMEDGTAPWYLFRNYFEHVRVGNGVMNLGAGAFMNSTELVSVDLADGLQEIGSDAFRDCTKLGYPALPDSITEIGAHAFAGCTCLKGVILPEAVVSVGDGAFSGCGVLSYALINGSTSLGTEAFAYCGLRYVGIHGAVGTIGDYAFDENDVLTDVWYYGSADDRNRMNIGSGNTCLTDAVWHYGTDGGYCGPNLIWELSAQGLLTISGSGPMYDWDVSETAPWYPYRRSIRSVSIGEGTTGIGIYAFRECSALVDVTLPDTLSQIGAMTFADCVNLAAVDLPESLTEVGYGAFSNCRSLGEIRIPSGVSLISERAFVLCTALTTLRIPGQTQVGPYAFAGCESLGTVILSGGVTGIADSAFGGCSALARVCYGGTESDRARIYVGTDNDRLLDAEWIYGIIGLGTCGDDMTWQLDFGGALTITGSGAMYDWAEGGAPWYDLRKEIRSVSLTGSVTTVGSSAFRDCVNMTTVDMGTYIWKVGESAFRGCAGLGYLPLPGTVTTVGPYAFAGCTSLTVFDLPTALTMIGDYSFSGCTSLWYVSINALQYTTVGEGVFSNCSLRGIGIHGDVRQIGRDAFAGNEALTDVWYPGSQSDRGNITIESGNGYLTGATWHYGEYGGYCGENITWRLSRSGRLGIRGSGSMYDMAYRQAPWYIYRSGITEAVIDSGVSYIGANSFFECGALIYVQIPDTVTRIGDCAFWDCSGLTEITIPKGVRSIGGGAFYSCEGFESIRIPESVEQIGEDAFRDCTALKELIVSGATVIGKQAFYSCTALEAVNLSGGVTAIGQDAFAGCSALRYVIYSGTWEMAHYNITYGSGNEPIINALWYYAQSAGSLGEDIWWVLYDNGLLEIFGSGAMPDWPDRNSVPWAADISNIIRVRISDGITHIGQRAFAGAVNLSVMRLGNGLVSIGSWAFQGCPYLRSVILPLDLTEIGEHAFEGCLGMIDITVGRSVERIGDYAFTDCTSMRHVTYLNTADVWSGISVGTGNYLFTGADRNYVGDSETLTLPAGLKELDEESLAGLPLYIVIPSGCERIAANAFDNCPRLAFIINHSDVHIKAPAQVTVIED